jgi:hypothetical protein
VPVCLLLHFDPSQQGLNDLLGPLQSFRCSEFGLSCDETGRQPGERHNCKPSKGPYLQPIDRYIAQLNQLKPNGAIIVSAITGPVGPVVVGMGAGGPMMMPTCKSSAGTGYPSIRLSSFVSAFGNRGTMTSICDGDFGPALDNLGNLVVEQVQLTWCLPYDPADTDPFSDRGRLHRGELARRSDQELQTGQLGSLL